MGVLIKIDKKANSDYEVLSALPTKQIDFRYCDNISVMLSQYRLY